MKKLNKNIIKSKINRKVKKIVWKYKNVPNKIL